MNYERSGGRPHVATSARRSQFHGAETHPRWDVDRDEGCRYLSKIVSTADASRISSQVKISLMGISTGRNIITKPKTIIVKR